MIRIYSFSKIMNYKKDDQKIPDKLNTFFKNAV